MFFLGFGVILGWFVCGLLLSCGEDFDWESFLFEIDNFILLERMSVDGRFGFLFNMFICLFEKVLWFLIEVWGLFILKEKLELFLSFFFCVKGEGDFCFGLWGFVFVKFLSVYFVCGGKSDFNLLIKFEDFFKLFFVLIWFMLVMEWELWFFFIIENLNGLFEFFDKLGNVKVFGVKFFLVIL